MMYVVRVNHKYNDEKEFDTFNEAMAFANKEKATKRFVEVMKLEETIGNTTYWSRVETYKNGEHHEFLA